jgi:hypothetical protein
MSSVQVQETQELIKNIQQRIENFEAGTVFTDVDFTDLCSSAATLQHVLLSIVEQDQINFGQVTEGIYYKVKFSKMFKPSRPLPPQIFKVLDAISRQTNEIFQYSGGYAANRLHLSTQVPMYYVFHTSGISRQFRLGGGVKVVLYHADDPRLLQFPMTVTGMAISALDYIDEAGADYKTIRIIKESLNQEDYQKLLLADLPNWMKNLLSDFEKIYEQK